MLVGVGVIVLVLLQHGKGADMGAAFGSGASGSLFGSSGSANFLSRTTAALAAVFFCTSLALSYLATNQPKSGASSVIDAAKSVTVPVAPDASQQAPATPAQPDSKAADIPK
ncbi:Preprotein translocase SecG subunit [Methyloversatilis universalis FAM5]|uniref:Protein-export membrane protein SecG n=1 Tax=Methyloversatilis universalis (strain ATCC BAA-1314 / DSM 25237 / JCM 13912 / CCUG 52030 / FAM5) TaxID=1000565 RepID=F5R8B3_METUF|nr:Preprotein translocase SecG subunit [Methyloversatilis universalis FAM5]